MCVTALTLKGISIKMVLTKRGVIEKFLIKERGVMIVSRFHALHRPFNVHRVTGAGGREA
jgi:hypothetical protein